ncbi:chitin synthase [Acanthocystis turfacea Chlorella virus MN0810.1]|nr:chitin synthase [Acanthocystis turfacea Chlorella virus MN0810.1]
MRMPLKIRSVLAYIAVLAANAAILSLIVVFHEYWYAFAPIMTLGAMMNIWCMSWVIPHAIYMAIKGKPKLSAPKEPMMFLVTAYNETAWELDRTIESVTSQKLEPGVTSTVVVIVDGEKTLAKNLMKLKYDEHVIVNDAYEDWHAKPKNVTFFKKTQNNVDVIYLIKSENAGKRDSVVLSRTLAYGSLFPGQEDRHAMKISGELELVWRRFVPAVTRMVGIDADTIFHQECTQALLEEMNYPGDRPVDGVVGYIDIDTLGQKSPYQKMWIWFQSVGYVVGQHVMRVYQSRITEKVSCLSGACYGIYIPTMCEPGLLREFNTPPNVDAGLFHSILGYASEDRRSVVLALCRDRNVRFRQSLDKRAIAYTIPPDSFTVFLSQRRRWSLGTMCNNLWLFLYGKNLRFTERLLALAQVLAFLFSPLYLAVNAYLIYVLVTKFDIMLIYISIPMFIVYLNNLLIPVWSPCFPSFGSRVAYYPKVVMAFFYSPWIMTIVQGNSILKSWSVSWGKTSVGTDAKTAVVPSTPSPV